MKKIIYLFGTKLTIFLASLSLATAASELILNYALERYQAPVSYILPDNAIKEQENSLNSVRYENIYELYRGIPNNYEIITIGDSFTNGGNVHWNETYPFQLFTKLDKKIPVSNLGICEDTTKGSYMRLEDYFQKNIKNGKKTIVIALVGAADLFFDTGVEFESVYKKYIKDGYVTTETIPFKIEEDLNFFQKLKTVNMINFLFKWSQKKSLIFLKSFFQKNSIDDELKPCFSREGDLRRDCFRQKFSELRTKNVEFFDIDISRRLTSSLVNYDNNLKQNKAERVVQDLSFAISEFPEIILSPEAIYNLIAYSTLQSKYSINNDLLPILRNALLKNKASGVKIINTEASEIDNSSSIVTFIEKWSTKTDRGSTVQHEYYEKIINLVHKNDGEIIFLTYPLDYKNTNSAIMNLTNRKNVHVVDIYKEFSRLIQNGFSENQLIGDWEHCTPKGYEIIASSVLSKIIELTRKDKSNTGN